MSVKVSQFKRPRPTKATIDILGDPVEVSYDRSMLTGDFLMPGKRVREQVAKLLISWDVVDDDGKPYQPAKDLNGERSAEWMKLFAPIPDDVIMRLWNGILDDFYAGNAAGGDSSGT